MTATEAKAILEPIPNDDFIVHKMFEDGKYCSAGYLFKNDNANLSPNRTFFDLKLEHPEVFKFCYFHPFYTSGIMNLAGINNSCSRRYPQSNPKDRVMALLDDMIAAGY